MAATPGAGRRGSHVPAGEAVAAVRQALGPAVRQADPPQLVRAADRRREEEVRPVGRQVEAGRLAGRDVAPHRRAHHQVGGAGEVAAATGASFGAVGGEEPDVVPGAAATGQAVAGNGQGRAVGQPGRRAERAVGAVRDPRHPAAGDLDDEDVVLVVEIVVAAPRGDERDAGAVGRPGRAVVAGRTIRQSPGRPALGVDEPEVPDLVVDEARTVEHPLETVEVAVVGAWRLAGLRRRRLPASLAILVAGGAEGGRPDDERPAVRRPLERVDPAREVGQAARLAAVERQDVDLRGVLAVLGGVGLLLDDRPPVGQEGQAAAVGREAGPRVVTGADGHLAGVGAPVGGDEPHACR